MIKAIVLNEMKLLGNCNMSWEKVKLDDVCKSIADGDHLPPPKVDNGIPFVTISNINSSNEFDFANTMYVSQEYYENLDEKRKPIVNDILYSVVGSYGTPVFIKEFRPFVFQRHIAILRPDESKIIPKYLYYKMLSNDFYMMADATAVGAAQKTISLTSLRNMHIDIPDIQTQKNIASIISAYDDLIENNNKRIKILEQMAENLYKEWFVRFRFPGHETTPIENGIPKGWNECRLGDCMLFNRGTSYSSEDIVDGDLALLSMNNIRPYGGYIADYSRSFSGKYKTEQIVHENDLIMSITDMTQDRRIIGYVGLVGPTEKKCVICTHLMKISSLVYHNYFLYGLFTFSGLSKSVSEQATGTNVLGLTAKILNKIKCVIPEIKLTNLYSQKVAPIFEEIHSIEKQNENLIKQRDLLLPRLMSGKLAV